jgi:hypothetical protein
LNSDSNPANPAAIAATAPRGAPLKVMYETSGWPISGPPKISCNIGDAMPTTPIPAETFLHSTIQVHQN